MSKKLISIRITALTARQLSELAARWGTQQTETIAVCIDRIYREEIPMTRYHFRVTTYPNAQQPPYDKQKRFMFAVEDTETGGIVHEEQEFLNYDAALNAARDYVAALRQS